MTAEEARNIMPTDENISNETRYIDSNIKYRAMRGSYYLTVNLELYKCSFQSLANYYISNGFTVIRKNCKQIEIHWNLYKNE